MNSRTLRKVVVAVALVVGLVHVGCGKEKPAATEGAPVSEPKKSTLKAEKEPPRPDEDERLLREKFVKEAAETITADNVENAAKEVERELKADSAADANRQ